MKEWRQVVRGLEIAWCSLATGGSQGFFLWLSSRGWLRAAVSYSVVKKRRFMSADSGLMLDELVKLYEGICGVARLVGGSGSLTPKSKVPGVALGAIFGQMLGRVGLCFTTRHRVSAAPRPWPLKISRRVQI
jgi:hypothetical protein